MAPEVIVETFETEYIRRDDDKLIQSTPQVPIISTFNKKEHWVHAVWNAGAIANHPKTTIENADPWKWISYGSEILERLTCKSSDGLRKYHEEQSAKWYEEYVSLNYAMLQRITATYQAGDIIWIHGLHYFLLPALIRRTLPQAIIGYQFHSPFQYRYPRIKPPPIETLFKSILESDVIAFPEAVSRECFESCFMTELMPPQWKVLREKTQLKVIPIKYCALQEHDAVSQDNEAARASSRSCTHSGRRHHVYHSSPLETVAESCVRVFEETLKEATAARLDPERSDTMGLPLRLDNLHFSYWEYLNHRLLLFDYDGTLTPIVPQPSQAKPSVDLLIVLETLIRDPRNSVHIISGRDRKFLNSIFGSYVGLGLCAEHGTFACPAGSRVWYDLLTGVDLSWQKEALPILQHFVRLVPGSEVEHKKASVTWHYRQAPNQDQAQRYAAYLYAHLLRYIESKYSVKVFAGKANIEIKPKAASKGAYVKRLLSTLGGTSRGLPDFVFCAGDDATDEDMFEAVQEADIAEQNVWTCFVGDPSISTRAEYNLDVPDELVTMLRKVCRHEEDDE